mmetsp:Transcript_2000/g.9027  ORF Transcript_2000/g.9027 Transcript_2000/m.9027 type:complete len:298 (-) Transcript_2000:14-907(-)
MTKQVRPDVAKTKQINRRKKDLLGSLGRLDARDGGGVVVRVEDGGARDEGVGAGVDDLVGVGGGDAAVDLDPRVNSLGVAHRLDLRDLLNLRLDEGLAAEAGVDGHDQDEVDAVEDVLEAFGGGSGVEDDARLASEVLDLVDGAVEVDGGRAFRVDGDDVGASLGEVRDAELGLDDHEVAVEHLVGDGAERVDDEGADGDVGDEAAVHDVDVDPLGAGLIDSLDLGAEGGEVGGEDGWGDDDGVLVARVHLGVGGHVERGASLGGDALVGDSLAREGLAGEDGGVGDGGHRTRRCGV